MRMTASWSRPISGLPNTSCCGPSGQRAARAVRETAASDGPSRRPRRPPPRRTAPPRRWHAQSCAAPIAAWWQTTPPWGSPPSPGARHLPPSPAADTVRDRSARARDRWHRREPPRSGNPEQSRRVDAPGGAAVLPRHPGRFAALLEKTGLIDHDNAIGRAQVLDDILPASIARRIRRPQRPAQHPLRAPWAGIADLLGQRPAVFALDRAQQTFEIEVCLPARVRPPKPNLNSFGEFGLGKWRKCWVLPPRRR